MGEVHETPNGEKSIPGDAVGHGRIVKDGVAAPVVMYGGKVVDPQQNTKPKYIILRYLPPRASVSQNEASINIGLLHYGCHQYRGKKHLYRKDRGLRWLD